jgi:hypothetical protein
MRNSVDVIESTDVAGTGARFAGGNAQEKLAARTVKASKKWVVKERELTHSS